MGEIKFYEVGGCVRDSFLGLNSKDIDFSVEAPSYEAMWSELTQRGFEIFQEKPEYLTIRARFPRTEQRYGGKTADFVMCRKDGYYSDGRRPDDVTPGNVYDDLARRDFTVNAIARDIDGNIIDPHGGVQDIERMFLRCVGATEDRFMEDSLRAVRAIRFRITKGFGWSIGIHDAMWSQWLADALVNVSIERVREELLKCFRFDTEKTLYILMEECHRVVRHAILHRDGLWLRPTLEE